MSEINTKTLANGALELTVIKFGAMRNFTMLGKMQAPGAQQDPEFMRAILASSFIVRVDEKGQREKVDLGGGDIAIDKAFRGHSIMVLIEAQNFAMEVNFGDFFADAARKVAERQALAADPASV